MASRDEGTTTASIGAGYPRSDLGTMCISNVAATTHYFIGNAWSCSIFDASRSGLFRFQFEAASNTAAGDVDLPASFALHAAQSMRWVPVL